MTKRTLFKILFAIFGICMFFILHIIGSVAFSTKCIIFSTGTKSVKPSAEQIIRINIARSLFREDPNAPEPKYVILSEAQAVTALYISLSHTVKLSEYTVDSLSEWELAAVIAHELAHAEDKERKTTKKITVEGTKITEVVITSSIPPLLKPHYFYDIRASELTSKEAMLSVLRKIRQRDEQFRHKNRLWFFLFKHSSFIQSNPFALSERIRQVRNADLP